MTIKDFYNLIIKHCFSDWEIDLDKKEKNVRMIEFWGITHKEQLKEYWNKKIIDWDFRMIDTCINFEIIYEEDE